VSSVKNGVQEPGVLHGDGRHDDAILRQDGKRGLRGQWRVWRT
jgi:hypothetical protein